MSIFSEIKEAAGDEPRSYSWYRDNVRMYFQKTDLYTEMTNLEESMIPIPGQLYLFEYKATYARKLKYYDEFPLVAVTGIENWGFHGINFHWGTSRNYTWNEIVGYLHVIQNDEIDYLRSLSYANFKTK